MEQLTTIKQVLILIEKVLHSPKYLRDGAHDTIFICIEINSLLTDNIISIELSDNVNTYLEVNRPSKEIHSLYYNNEHYHKDLNEFSWWNITSITPIKKANLIIEEKKKFLRMLIKQLDKESIDAINFSN